jgi:hypothetical protein
MHQEANLSQIYNQLYLRKNKNEERVVIVLNVAI